MRTRRNTAVATALMVMAILTTTSFAQHRPDSHPDRAGALIKTVRQATERFRDVSVAEAEGYKLTFGCVTGPDSGAMGLHYVNFPLVATGTLDPTHPQIVIYEPTTSGKPRLTGADFLVLAEAWDKAHPGAPPELMGQLFAADPRDVLETPLTLIGSVSECAERLQARRERWGYSYTTIPGEKARDFAPLVQKLTGT